MKKTFALILAFAMVMSMAAISFADDAAEPAEITDNTFALTGPYKYSSDSDVMDSGAVLQYGKSTYYGITIDNKFISDYDQVEKLKVKAKWEMGSDLIESLSIVKKHATNLFIEDTAVDAGYYYFVEIKVAKKETTSDADIIGTLTFNRKKDSKDNIGEIDDIEKDISFNVFYGDTWLTALGKIAGDKDYLKWDTKYALKFDSDDEVELGFGAENDGSNEGTFTVDVSGQGKLYFYYLTDANEAIAEANPNAKMKFINFFNTKFNRTGEFAYEMENGAYAYQIVDGKLTAIPGCEYDDSDETFYFNTRVLGSYVFSDVELVDAPAEVTAPEVEEPAENPETGAAA